VGIRCADHVTPLYPHKLALTSPTGGGRSVGIVFSRTNAMEFLVAHCYDHKPTFFYSIDKQVCHSSTPSACQSFLFNFFLFHRIYLCIYIFFFYGAATQRGSMESSFMRFLDHKRRRTTVGRTPLDE
jgi:hypothetical protein